MLETSAASWQGKVSTSTQEVSRRLIKMAGDLKKERVKIIDTYCDKHKRSGYSKRQIVDIVTSGVVGHARRYQRLRKEHREGWETAGLRDSKKLTGKLCWFWNKKKAATTHEQVQVLNTERQQNSSNNKKTQKSNRDERQTASVLFDKRTTYGELASRLKDEEQRLS